MSFWSFYISWWTIAKGLRTFETCVSVNNNLCGKSVSSLESPTAFDKRLKVTSVLFLFPILNY